MVVEQEARPWRDLVSQLIVVEQSAIWQGVSDWLVCYSCRALESDGATVLAVKASPGQWLGWEVVVCLRVRGIRLGTIVIEWCICKFLTNHWFQDKPLLLVV